MWFSTLNWASIASKTKYSLRMRLFTCLLPPSKRWWWWDQCYSRISTCSFPIQVRHTSMMFHSGKASSSHKSYFWARPFSIFSWLIPIKLPKIWRNTEGNWKLGRLIWKTNKLKPPSLTCWFKTIPSKLKFSIIQNSVFPITSFWVKTSVLNLK